MTIAHATIAETPVGPFTIIARDDVVLAAGFTDDVDDQVQRIATRLRPTELHRNADLGPVSRAVDAYFAGDLSAIDSVAVEQRSGPFLERAFAELRRIPAGTTISYSELAKRSDRPRAVRAAGEACGRNMAALFVPCHRVLAADGTLHHYGYGVAVKHALLAHEGVLLAR